jgi:hypothetical protein
VGVTLWVAIAIGNAEAARTIEDLAQLRTAMMSRACIGQAKGILMERHKIKEEKAFTILTPTSQRTNTKLRDVAAELVRTGGCAVPVDTLHVQQDWTTTSLRISSPAGFAVTEPNSPSGPRQRRPACCGFRRRSTEISPSVMVQGFGVIVRYGVARWYSGHATGAAGTK